MLSQNIQVDQVLGYFAAGTTKRTSAILDMSGWEGVLFIAELGTIIADGTIDVFVDQDAANSTASMARLATTTAHTVTTANEALTQSCILVDVYQPLKRYVQCNITPAVQNAVILGITAIRYKGHKVPSGSVTALKSTVLQSPEEA